MEGGAGERPDTETHPNKLKAVCSCCHPLSQSDFYLSLGNSFEGPDVFILLAGAYLCVCVVVCLWQGEVPAHDSQAK